MAKCFFILCWLCCLCKLAAQNPNVITPGEELSQVPFLYS